VICTGGWSTGSSGLAGTRLPCTKCTSRGGLTPFEVQAALLGIPGEALTHVRLAAPERLTREVADRIRDELREFAHLGGFTLRPGSTPWFGAALRTPDQARQAYDLTVRLGSHGLPAAIHRIARAAEETGLRPPQTYRAGVAVMRLYAAVALTRGRLAPAVYAASPDRLAAAVGDGGDLAFLERRALRKQARALATGEPQPSREELPPGAARGSRAAGRVAGAELGRRTAPAAGRLPGTGPDPGRV